MEYFIMSNSIDFSSIGPEYPQIQTVGGTIDVKASNSIFNVYSNRFPDFIPNLDYLVLHPKAKLTDILSASMISPGFIVSERTKLILENHYLMDYRFFPTTIKQESNIYNYYWFYFIGDLTTYIDFEKTQFLIVDSFGDTEILKIKDKNDLERIYQSISSLKKIRSRKIIFNDIPFNYDLFHLHLADNRMIISKKLYQSFKEVLVTGCDIQPATFL